MHAHATNGHSSVDQTALARKGACMRVVSFNVWIQTCLLIFLHYFCRYENQFIEMGDFFFFNEFALKLFCRHYCPINLAPVRSMCLLSKCNPTDHMPSTCTHRGSAHRQMKTLSKSSHSSDYFQEPPAAWRVKDEKGIGLTVPAN